MVVSAVLIVGLPKLKTWWGQGSVGAPEWTEYIVMAVSWSGGFQVVSQGVSVGALVSGCLMRSDSLGWGRSFCRYCRSSGKKSQLVGRGGLGTG